MKIKGDYLLDTIGGEKMAVPITVNDGGLAGLIRLNEVGAFIDISDCESDSWYYSGCYGER